MTREKWDRRISRANELTSCYPFATEGLRFYSHVATFQKSFYREIQKTLADSPKTSSDRPLRDELDLFLLLPKFPGFLSMIEQIAPVPLARAAASLAQKGPAESQRAIEDFWYRDAELAAGRTTLNSSPLMESLQLIPMGCSRGFFFSRTPNLLRTNVNQRLSMVRPRPVRSAVANLSSACCAAKATERKKSLVCMLCAHEWDFRRIYCPACGEEREPQMAYYSAPEIAHVRVDVCDTCHTYLKSVDLTKTGLAVAVVDELATIPLDLWAREHGYEKLQMNLLGT